jgi:hypothetical protein
MNLDAPTKHWRFGGSTASMWLNCDGWYATTKESMKVESPEMKKGTEFHRICHQFALGTFAGEMPTECAPHATAWAKLVGPNWQIEEECELMNGVAGTTLDAVWYDELTDTLHVADLKTGEMLVHAYDNEQLLFGAVSWCVAKKMRPANYHLHIVQGEDDADVDPDGSHRTHRSWCVTLEELAEFEKRVYSAINRNHKACEWEVTPSDKCGFCSGRVTCKAHLGMMQYVTAGAEHGITVVDLPDPTDVVKILSHEQMAQILRCAPYVKKMIANVEKLALSLGGVPGYEVGTTKPYPKWRLSDADTLDSLKALGIENPSVPLSPAKARDALAKTYGKVKAAAAIARLTETPEGEPKLVPCGKNAE